MKGSTLPYWLTGVVLLVAAFGFARTWQAQQGAAAQSGVIALDADDRAAANEPPLTDFQLTTSEEKTFDSKAMHGHVWVPSFFFVSCPSTCLRLNQALSSLYQDPAYKDVKFVSITCDPENDSPEVLAKYAERFKADPERWYFCTGEFDHIKRIGVDRMKVAVERQTHANHGIVIDRAGKVRGRFNVLEPRELDMMQQLLVQCLAEPAPAAMSSPEADEPPATEAPAAADGAKEKS